MTRGDARVARIVAPDRKVVTVSPTDAELVAACLAGRRDAFNAMVERQQRQI